MSTLQWIIATTALGGIASAAVAGIFLLLPEVPRSRILPHLVSFATGALLGAALLALLPEAMERVGAARAHDLGVALVAGLGLFFIIEKIVLWQHAHTRDEADEEDLAHHHHHVSAVLVLAGDSIHNALDGVLIAAAFLTNVPLGVMSALAVAAHEIPHRVGDFAILLNAGMSRRRALALNVATSLTAVLGAVLAYFGLQQAIGMLPYALAVAAAGFLYVAVAGLIPGLHRSADLRTSLAQVILIGLGVAVIAWAESHAH
jgi:zinc and cadmium transporter